MCLRTQFIDVYYGSCTDCMPHSYCIVGMKQIRIVRGRPVSIYRDVEYTAEKNDVGLVLSADRTIQDHIISFPNFDVSVKKELCIHISPLCWVHERIDDSRKDCEEQMMNSFHVLYNKHRGVSVLASIRFPSKDSETSTVVVPVMVLKNAIFDSDGHNVVVDQFVVPMKSVNEEMYSKVLDITRYYTTKAMLNIGADDYVALEYSNAYYNCCVKELECFEMLLKI